jgi:hypothetical protein
MSALGRFLLSPPFLVRAGDGDPGSRAFYFHSFDAKVEAFAYINSFFLWSQFPGRASCGARTALLMRLVPPTMASLFT